MGAERKKVPIMAGGLVALIIIAAIAVVLLFDINSYKPRIENAASEATGLDVRINGKMGLSFFPFGVSVNDIHVSNKGGEILSLKELKLGVKLIPLLTKQLKVTKCELVKPTISIVKDAEGKYNFGNSEKKSAGEGLGAASSLNELRLSQGTLVYLDKKTGEKTELKEINLTIKDLLIGDSTEAIIKNGSFTGSFDSKEVLQKNFRIENLKAQVKAVKGIYNIEPLTIGALVYFDKVTSEKTELEEINLTIKDLPIADTSEDIIKHISFTGNMTCKAVRKKHLRIDNVKSPIDAVKGVIYLIPLTMDIFGGKGEGDATVDMSEADTVYKINLKISKLDFAKLEESFGANEVVGGKGDFYASLTMKEKESHALMSSVDGTFSLRGDNLVIYTMDLDKVLSSYETSQEFNLVDLGAFLIAGPFGSLSVVALHAYSPLSAVALKAYRYGDLYSKTRGGKGDITQFISHWKIKGGVADATDCAFSTRHNRVALKGKLNLVSERFDNVTVALLDDKGCIKFKQSVVGSFGSPQISGVSAVGSLGGPFSNLYRKAKSFFRGGKCEVFYNGAVRQP
jgi:AsmA family/AsmA-like C-terminal region